jgi:hypothetical protein
MCNPVFGNVRIPSLLFLLFLLRSCIRDGCPLSAGSPVTEKRELPPFGQIILYDKVNLVITQDTVHTAQITAGKNLLPGIQTEVSDGVLTIRDKNTCLIRNPSDQVTIYLSADQLRTITYYGAGNVESTNTLRAEIFTVDGWLGSGTIRLDLRAAQVNALVRNENATIVLTGAADSAYVYCGEAGSADLSGLATPAVGLDSKSIRDIYVNASRALHANIVYKGNVYYKGNPAVIDTLLTSSGRLIHLP